MLVQIGLSCLLAACVGGHLEVVKYLYGCGGEALLMLTDKVGWQEAGGGCCIPDDNECELCGCV